MIRYDNTVCECGMMHYDVIPRTLQENVAALMGVSVNLCDLWMRRRITWYLVRVQRGCYAYQISISRALSWKLFKRPLGVLELLIVSMGNNPEPLPAYSGHVLM